MINKDELLNGYKVLYEKLDENYLELTVKQLMLLQANLQCAWKVLSPRGTDRRGK